MFLGRHSNLDPQYLDSHGHSLSVPEFIDELEQACTGSLGLMSNIQELSEHVLKPLQVQS
jgi:hypothetical protein